MTAKNHPAVQHVLKFFATSASCEHLESIYRGFETLAINIAELDESPEVTVALRKLLEAQDASCRAYCSGKVKGRDTAELEELRNKPVKVSIPSPKD